MAVFYLQWMSRFSEQQQHYECPDETAEEVEAENESEINRRNNPNRRITTNLASIAEVKVAISGLKLNKAAGTDDIFPKLLKYGAEEVAAVLRPLLLEL